MLVKGAIVTGSNFPVVSQAAVADGGGRPQACATHRTDGWCRLEHSGACPPICLPINRFDPGQPRRWCRESASAAPTMPPTLMSLIREELAQLTEATSKVEIQGGRYLSP